MPTSPLVVSTQGRWYMSTGTTREEAYDDLGDPFSIDGFPRVMPRAVWPYRSVTRNPSTGYITTEFVEGLNTSGEHESQLYMAVYSWDLDAIRAAYGITLEDAATVTIDVLYGQVMNSGESVAPLFAVIPVVLRAAVDAGTWLDHASGAVLPDPTTATDWEGVTHPGIGELALAGPAFDPRDTPAGGWLWPAAADGYSDPYGNAGTWTFPLDLSVNAGGPDGLPGRWVTLYVFGANVRVGISNEAGPDGPSPDPTLGGSTRWAVGLNATLTVGAITEMLAAPPLWQGQRIGVADAPDQFARGLVSPQSSPWQGGML